MATTFVLGLGNVLMGDDAFGPAVVHAFEDAYSVAPEVDIVDLGTPGLDLTPWITDADRLIVVDTVKSDRPPGTLCLYSKRDVMRQPPGPRVGPHDPGLRETLGTLELLGRAPREVTIVGIVPQDTGLGRPLSPPVQAGVAKAIEAIVAMLEDAGLGVWRRATPLAASPLWRAVFAH